MNISSKVCFVAAAICFGLAALKVQTPFDLTNAGYCLLTIGLFLL